MTATDPLAGPTPAADRIPTLDIVRGVALLGIFIMNMPWFSTSFYAEADGSRLWPDALNRNAELLRDMLFSGKFNSMFSLLFGLGFTLQLGRMMQRDPSGAPALYLRRLAVLMVIALLHTCLVWTGDVLHMYALLGLGLLLLRDAPNRVIVALIVATLLYPPISGTLRILVMSPEVVARLVAEAKSWEASNNLAYGHGSFLAAAHEHTREFLHFYSSGWSLWGMLGGYMQFITTMLIGFLIGRNGLLGRIPELLPTIRRLQWWTLGIGLACAALFGALEAYTRTPGPSVLKVGFGTAYVFSRLGLMLFYVLSIVRLAQLPSWQRRLAPFAAAGRMPLSNYLLQSLMGTAIFYGWGLGLWGRVGPAADLAIAVALFFLVQVPLSIAWLKHHDTGPMEALWRRLTYGARPYADRVAGHA